MESKKRRYSWGVEQSDKGCDRNPLVYAASREIELSNSFGGTIHETWRTFFPFLS